MDQSTVNLILGVVGILAGLAFKIWLAVKAKYKLAEGNKGKAFEIAEQAVKQTYDTIVREAKSKAADGKLSKEDITDALNNAWANAVNIGKEKGFDFAKHVAREYFPVLVDKAIKLVKKG